MKFRVKRSKWLRGEGSGASYLLRACDGKMCCVGFACQTINPDAKILGKATAYDVDPRLHDKLFKSASLSTFHAIYRENDSVRIGDEEREERLMRLFKHCGHKIEFVD